MSRYWGHVGIKTGVIETAPGTHEVVIEPVEVVGDLRTKRVSISQGNVRGSIGLQHVLSILSPVDFELDFTQAVYIEWQGRKWVVTAIRYIQPRVELSIGGIYNGPGE